MSDKRKILIQLDSDPHPSVFDRVAAVDAGADEIFSYGNIAPGDVRALVYGAIFTRQPKDLKHTAIFIGGSQVDVGEKLMKEAASSFFGPMRVSLMLDSNGANTTAAAAVIAARKHHSLAGAKSLVLGGTGPVGRRVALLLARERSHVRVGSRQAERAASVCADIAASTPNASLEPIATGSAAALQSALAGVEIVIAAGAPGVVLLPQSAYAGSSVKLAVDLNAVPPVGIEGVDSADAGMERAGVRCYGAIGVGGTKMKIHKRCVAQLFESNSLVLDAAEIYEIGTSLPAPA